MVAFLRGKSEGEATAEWPVRPRVAPLTPRDTMKRKRSPSFCPPRRAGFSGAGRPNAKRAARSGRDSRPQGGCDRQRLAERPRTGRSGAAGAEAALKAEAEGRRSAA